jgi:hypothetical protein
MTGSKELAPLTLFEYDHQPGTYCLMLTDRHMVAMMDTFTEHGYEGNGYGWTGVARSAVRTRLPDIADRVRFDPEAGMFVAFGDDHEALWRLGGVLRDAVRDPSALTELIRAGDPDWFD